MEYQKGPELPRFRFPTPEYYDYGVLYDIIIQYKNFLKPDSESLDPKEHNQLFQKALKAIKLHYEYEITRKLDVSTGMFEKEMSTLWHNEKKKKRISDIKENIPEKKIDWDAEMRQRKIDLELRLLNRDDY
jgi:hypothetical protein